MRKAKVGIGETPRARCLGISFVPGAAKRRDRRCQQYLDNELLRPGGPGRPGDRNVHETVLPGVDRIAIHYKGITGTRVVEC